MLKGSEVSTSFPKMEVWLQTTWWHDLWVIVVPLKNLPQSRYESEFHFGTQQSPATSCVCNYYSHMINPSGGSISLLNIKHSLSLTLVWLAEVINTMFSWQSSMPKPIICDKNQWFRSLCPKCIHLPPEKMILRAVSWLLVLKKEKYFLLKLYMPHIKQNQCQDYHN